LVGVLISYFLDVFLGSSLSQGKSLAGSSTGAD
jgi:hypothetical protein